MTTTPRAIREAMVTLIESVTPAQHAAFLLRAHREAVPFRASCEAAAGGCLRRFSVRFAGASEPPLVNDTLVQEIVDTAVIEIAYPTDARFGENALTALDDVIDSDARLIEAKVGPPGYSAFASLVAPAVVSWTTPIAREVEGPVTYSVINYTVAYHRSLT